MPIPTEGAWPPPHLAPAYHAYRDWDAWFTGDADRLRNAYRNRGIGGRDLPPSQRVRASQYAGGLAGFLSRWLWGSPPPAGSRDGRIHCPLPADLARTSASLLFSEPPTLTSKKAEVQKRLDQLVEDGLIGVLKEAAEAASVLGDVYLRPVVDRQIYDDRAFLAPVHADGAIPVLRWGRLIEVTFWSELTNDGSTVIRLLEHHDVDQGSGRIEYALHEGNADQLGKRVPLTEHPDAVHLADLIDDTGFQSTGLARLDVIRVRKPGVQRRWRTQPGLKYLGRSDFDGGEQFFDALDETWTSWMRDIRLGRGRLVVPEFMLASNGPGMGATFDPDREVYSAVNAMPEHMTGAGITMAQFEIRVEQHQQTAEAITQVAMRHAGLSSQTLGDQGDIAVTATEVQARERMSFTTRGDEIDGMWTPAIADIVELLLEVEAREFGGPSPERPDIEFPDGVSEAPEQLAQTLQLIAAAEAASVDTKVRMLHPDWDETQVRDEVARIKEDQPKVDLGGGFGDDDPAAGDEGQGDPEADPEE